MSSSTSVAKNDVKQVIQMMNDNEIILTKSLPASVQGSMFVKLVPATFFNELLKWSEMNNSDVGIDSVINVYIDSMKALVTPESYNAFVLSSSSNDSSSSRKSTSSKQQANNNNKLSIIPDSLELLYNEEIENNFKIVTTDVGEMLEKCLSSLISSSSSSKTNNNNNPSIKFLRRWLHVSSDKDKFVVEFWPFVLNVSLSTGVSNNTEQIIPVFSILVSHISPIKHIPNLLRNSLVLVTDVKSSSKNVFFENDIIKSSAAADRNEMRVWMKTCSNDDNNNNDDEEKKNVGNSNGNGEPIKKNSIAEEWQLLVETGEADNDEEDSEDGPETVKDALLTANNIKPIAGDHPGRVLFYFLLEKKLANGKWPRADATDPDNAAESKPRPVASKSSRAHTMSFSAANPQVGQEVDVQRLKDDKWYESRIVSVETKAEGLFVTVHFLSFPSSDDEVFHCLSDRLRPRNTKVPNWRSQLRIEEEIDINKSQVFKDEGSSTISRGIRFIRFRVGRGGGLKAEEPAEWVLGTVKKVDFSNQKRVLVRIKFGSMWNQGKEEWVPLDSEYIAPKYTHTPKPVQTTSSPSIPGKPQVQGIVGLRNLGNTCFMNSMLQCLSSTIPLTNYFISGEYSDHINLKNALGAGGQLAITYAGVMDEMWNGSFTTVVPVEFKRVLGIFAPQFQGYAQQDSHEFLSLLMDGLHEDLNKIQKKPATEPVESKGKTDPVVANESWEVFKKRNDSFIVDNLMGMMRSHLTCPKCKTEATKFDPYSNISLPIPSSQLEKYEIVFVGFSSASPKDSSKGIRQLIATRYTVFVPKRSSAKALASWLESELKIPASDMILTTLSNNKFFPSMIMYQDPDVDVGLPTHSEDDIIAIQLDSISSIIEAQKEYTKVLNARLATSSKMKTRAKKAKKKLKKKRAAQWENIERMFRTLSKPSEIIDAWLEMGPPENDLQIELVQRLSNITLDFEGGSYLPQAVAKYAIGKVKSFELDISPALSHWATNELMLKDLTPESVSPSIPNQNEDDDPSNGRRNSAQGNKDDAQYVLIPIQFQVEGIKYTSFRAMHVIRILRNSTHSEVHKCIWQHVRSIFNPDFKPSQSFMQTVDPSLRPVDSNDNDSDDDDDDSGSGYDVKDFPYLIKSSGYSQESNFPFNDELVNWPSQSMAMQEGLTVMLLKDGIENLLEGISVTSSSGNGYNRRMGGEISFDDRNRRMNLGTVNLHLSFTKIHKGDANSSDSDDGVTTLKQCFEKFRLREQLSEHDEWYCPTCKEHVQAFKKMDLWDAPDVLIVHLKRFLYETRGRFSVYGGSAVQREKINDMVKFPLTGLDLSEFIIGDTSKSDKNIYDLFAVSNHIGSMGGGHYTAYVKSPNDNCWYEMDDSRTSLVPNEETESRIISPLAYVLFYQRRGTKRAIDTTSNRPQSKI